MAGLLGGGPVTFLLKSRTRRTEKALARCHHSGQIAGARLDGQPSPFDAHVQPVPAILGDTLRRVADEVALAELFENGDAPGAQVAGRVDLEYVPTCELAQVAEERRRAAGRHRVDDDIGAPRRFH